MIPSWLHNLSIVWLATGACCGCLIAVDELRHPQRMWIMNLVWPVVALFGTVLTLWLYFVYGRLSAADRKEKRELPFAIMVAKGASHCGRRMHAGGYMCGMARCRAAPSIAVWFGWRSLFAEKMYAVWVLDFIFAFGFGVAFQYFTIAPMRKLGVGAGLRAAVKADALSLASWQIGMYGFMAFAKFYLFRAHPGRRARRRKPSNSGS